MDPWLDTEIPKNENDKLQLSEGSSQGVLISGADIHSLLI